MIHVVVVVGVVPQEGETVLTCLHAAHELVGQDSVLLGVHHRGEVGLHGVAAVCHGVDAGCHAVAATSVDEDDTVGALGTVDGCSVLKDGDLLDVINVYSGEDVVEETVVYGCIAILQVLHHTVEDDKGLCGRVQRVDALQHYQGAHAGRAGTVDDAEVAAQLALHLALDGQCRVGVDVGDGLSGDVKLVLHIFVELVGEQLDDHVALGLLGRDDHAGVAGGRDVE